MILPIQALKLLFTKPKLLGLCLVPGAFTFLVSGVIGFATWHFWLANIAFWLAVPTIFLVFLITWLIVGNLSLIPVEDAIIDFCQKEVLGEIGYPALEFRIKRLLREGFYSVFLAFFAVFLFLLSFFPLFTIVSFTLAALLTSFNFSRALLTRLTDSRGKQVAIFFESGISYVLLGIFLNILLFIPIVNVFLLGYAQILATLVFLRNQKKA